MKPKSLDVSKAIDRRGGNAHLAQEIAEAIKAARESRGWTAGQADNHFCGGSTNWTWYEGRKGLCRPPSPGDFARIAEEWPELQPLTDLIAEAEREQVGIKRAAIGLPGAGVPEEQKRVAVTAPATPEAERWEGFGTALKPAHEPVVVARKPLSGTVAATVLEHGTGALNVDGCRVGTAGDLAASNREGHSEKDSPVHVFGPERMHAEPSGLGRWPANVVLDEQAARLLDEQTGELAKGSGVASNGSGGFGGGMFGDGQPDRVGGGHGYVSSPSRFFYCAKSGAAERSAGLNGDRSTHPTVKPISLMRWLVRLVTPPDGTVLDPFCGSGSTGCAAVLEGFDFIGLERETEYVEIARARIAWWHKHRGDGEAADILAAGEARDEVEATGQLDMFG